MLCTALCVNHTGGLEEPLVKIPPPSGRVGSLSLRKLVLLQYILLISGREDLHLQLRRKMITD